MQRFNRTDLLIVFTWNSVKLKIIFSPTSWEIYYRFLGDFYIRFCLLATVTLAAPNQSGRVNLIWRAVVSFKWRKQWRVHGGIKGVRSSEPVSFMLTSAIQTFVTLVINIFIMGCAMSKKCLLRLPKKQKVSKYEVLIKWWLKKWE